MSHAHAIVEIDAELDRVLADVADAGGEIEPALADWIDRASGAIDWHLDQLLGAAKDAELRANARWQERVRIEALVLNDRNRAERIRNFVLKYMAEHDLKRVSTARFEITRAANGGKLPIDLIADLDPAKVEARFQKTKIELNLDAVREALMDAETLPFARLGERANT